MKALVVELYASNSCSYRVEPEVGRETIVLRLNHHLLSYLSPRNKSLTIWLQVPISVLLSMALYNSLNVLTICGKVELSQRPKEDLCPSNDSFNLYISQNVQKFAFPALRLSADNFSRTQ